ncbi:MAG: DUF5110 domain-containing protein [Bacteroidaceae bacterium]|nr:DUF5110 domain-containing protein [Bacteroidaceae bacterium]
MKSPSLAVLLLTACAASLKAQTIEFFTPRTVRIVRTDDGANKRADKSLSVVATPEAVKVSRLQKNGTTVYRSSALTVTVRQDGRITFADRNGNILMQEGDHAFTPITDGADKGAWKVRQAFAIGAQEGLYGVGLLQNGKLSQRGENRRMIQSNLEDYANVFQSSRGYGIFWDNYSPTQLTTPAEGEAGEWILESEVGRCADYYFVYGGNADGVIRELRHLTGQAPMLPRWTYGFHQSRERYKSSAELLEVVHRYRDLHIPFDGIIQDWQYWGSNYTWNAMEFLSPDFSNAQQMIDEVHRQHAHMSISIWSSFGPMTKAFREMQEKNHLLSFITWPQSGIDAWPPRKDYPSGVRCYDPFSAEARDIYWNHLSRLHKMGIDAWWMDSTDPDHHDYQESDLDEQTAMGTYRSVRNAFPLMAVGGVHDHQRAVDSSKRVFILTRSYFAGQQRYGAQTWSGDIGSSWDSFRKQIPICLNYTLTANPFVNTDIGGFFAGAYNTQGARSATRNPQYQELYVRWMQFGAFCPMMRSHGTDVPRELYYYGKAGEPVYNALVDAVRLRYRFLPYTYSLSWQVSHDGDSFMRALFMDFPGDEAAWNCATEYMYGHNILVCPVLRPQYTEERIIRTNEMSGWDKNEVTGDRYKTVDWTAEKPCEVYLPKGAQWYDYWTGKRYDGGQELTLATTLAHSPLFIKAGSIIPAGPDVQYNDEQPTNAPHQRATGGLTIDIYPGADATFTLYEDEGDNYNYEQGRYSTITFIWNDRSRTLTIGQRQGSFEGMAQTRDFKVNVISGAQRTVSYAGKKTNVKL